jgi:hypothetical protein
MAEIRPELLHAPPIPISACTSFSSQLEAPPLPTYLTPFKSHLAFATQAQILSLPWEDKRFHVIILSCVQVRKSGI